MANIKIRPATKSDLPTLSHIDDLANATHPMRKIRFQLTPRAERDAILLSALESAFKIPTFRFFVATIPDSESEEKVVGFLAWIKHGNSEEKKEMLKEKEVEAGSFDAYSAEIMRRCRERYRLDEYHMLETLVILPGFQRRGIGRKLMDFFMEDLEKEGEGRGCVIVSSKAGRGLYERFGWELIGENVWELGKWGWEEPYVSFVMKREVEA